MTDLKSTLRSVVPALCSCLIAALLAVTVFEGVLRLGIVHNPRYDHLRIQGQVNRPRHKLLILGDSFFLKDVTLGSYLAQDLGSRNVATLNLATSGAGPFEYLFEMRTAGVGFKPDVVLLSYYAGNDLTNVQNNRQFVSSSEWDKRTGISINTSSTRPFFQHFYIYHYLLPTLQALRVRSFNYRKAEAAGVPQEIVQDARELRVNPFLLQLAANDKNNLRDNILMETAENRQAWEKSKELLAEIHKICNRIGAEFVMVIFPHTLQVNRSHYEFFRQLKFNLPEPMMHSTVPQTLFLSLCEQQGVRCLDLLPVLKSHPDQELYLDKDEHLNHAGNLISKEPIEDFLLKNTSLGK